MSPKTGQLGREGNGHLFEFIKQPSGSFYHPRITSYNQPSSCLPVLLSHVSENRTQFALDVPSLFRQASFRTLVFTSKAIGYNSPEKDSVEHKCNLFRQFWPSLKKKKVKSIRFWGKHG